MLENAGLHEKYAIDKLVGNGSFSIVYRATERSCGRTVAIKALRREVYDSTSHQYADSEVCAMGRLWSHPNIVSVHTVEPGDDDYISYIVMEYVDGGSLRRQLQGGALHIRDALAYAYDICASLAYAHSEKVLHRDVKPRNVLLTSSRVAKVSDFGVAQVRDVHHDYASTFAGTRRYMAPEQYEEKYDHRVDIYAAGILLWEMATGEYPFMAGTQDLIRRAKDTEPEPPSWLPEDVRDILRSSLRTDPFERFRDVAEMRDAVEQTLMSSYERAVLDSLSSGAGDGLAGDPVEPLRDGLRIPRAAAVSIERCAFQERQQEKRAAEAARAEQLAEELARTLMEHVRHDDSPSVENALKQMREAEIAPQPVLELVRALWRQVSGPSYSPRVIPPAASVIPDALSDDDGTALGEAADDESTALRLKAEGKQHELDKKWRRARSMYRRSAKAYERRAQSEQRVDAMAKAARLYQSAGECFGLAEDARRSHATYGQAASCWMHRAEHYHETEKWEHAAESHRFAARAYDQAERKGDAEEEYLAAADLLYKRARSAYERHAYEDAAELCQRAVRLASGSSKWRMAEEARHLLHAARNAWS